MSNAAVDEPSRYLRLTTVSQHEARLDILPPTEEADQDIISRAAVNLIDPYSLEQVQ